MNRWNELADGVLARRHDELDLTTGLVLGAERALVVDTRGDVAQGRELASAVRGITSLPVAVVVTHAHFDHCFGTAAFLPAPVYAHARCARVLNETAAAQRAEWSAHYRNHGDHATADALARTRPVPPDHPVPAAATGRAGGAAGIGRPAAGPAHPDPVEDRSWAASPAQLRLDLGGREVILRHTGRGHTDHDLAVHVPDAGVLFGGDLFENGAPPDFGDAFPLEWADTVRLLLEVTEPALVVPGHGDPMTPAQAQAQQAELAEVAALAQAVACSGLDVADAEARSPFPGVPWPRPHGAPTARRADPNGEIRSRR